MRLCFEQIHSADRFELEVNPWSCPAPLIQDISLKPLEGRPLFVGNSLAIRQIDRLFHPSRPTPIFCNRGLSGIDGNIATAAGLADGLGTPIRALIGDQAFLHDLNSLPLMGNVLLIVQNNRGGRIFDTLAHTAASPFNEKLFVNAHKLTFASAAALFEIPYFSKTALDETRGLIEWS
jgi:2-succinyl-5-enolpyruvyl-6-hydroxy-3-cyclohexene-1-carboxylate synthase